MGTIIFRYDSYNKTSGFSFRCLNTKCRRKYSVLINSFFNLFPYVPLKIISEVIKTFLCIELNAEEAYKYLKDKNINISKIQTNKIYKEIKKCIQQYLQVFNSMNL